MPAVKPFAGVRYDLSKVSPGSVVAPPYDVIDDHLRNRLYDTDPHNIIRLILGRGADPYADAARLHAEWTRTGVLTRDPVPSLYLLEQEFRLADGRSFVRSGFIAACLLEEFGGSVMPHEKTHSGPKEDRLKLMNATGMMFSQIFSLYPDPEGVLTPLLRGAKTAPPEMTAEFDGVVNRMWVCRDQAVSLGVSGFLRDKRVLVADGHHRYETALAYRNGMRMKNPGHGGHEAYNFVPMFFCSMHDPGMLVLPTHRVLRGIDGFDAERFLGEAGKFFTATLHPSLAAMTGALEAASHPAVGLAFSSSPGFHLLELRPEGARMLEGVPPVVARLDVTVLHELLLGRIVGLSALAQEKKTNLEYERDAGEALRMLNQPGGAGGGKGRQAVFFMRSTPLDDVRLVAEAGLTLPQKSTYFFPKLLSGMVSYVFDGEDVR